MGRGEFPLVAVVGPTGSGKSELGIAIAEEFGGEIVNCDSLQVYRYFDIGTAKLGMHERHGVPHHLIDIVDPDQPFTAGDYAALARPLVAGIAGRGCIPVVVGGTGFYLRALIDGLFAGPARHDALRRRLVEREHRRSGSLHRILKRLDPVVSRKIHPNDIIKTIRALEVTLVSRRPISELYGEGRDALQGFRVLKIGLDPPRASLYAHVNVRCQRMFDLGLVDEVRGILALGYAPDLKPFESHGYKQALDLVQDRLSLDEALDQAMRNTRRYAKRQLTWFHHEKEVLWYTGFGNDPAISGNVLRRVREFIADFPGFQ